MNIPNIPALLTEFMGSFIFLYVIIATGNPWAMGAALAVLGYLGGTLSGAHFNPVVSVMKYINRSITAQTAIGYIVVQVAAGLLALLAYKRFKL